MDDPDGAYIQVLFELARPRLVRLFRAYGIAPKESEDLIQDAMHALSFRWRKIRNRREYLVGTVRSMCRRRRLRRLRSAIMDMDPALLEQLTALAASGADAGQARLDLERLLHPLAPHDERLLRLALRLDRRQLAVVLQGVRPTWLRRDRVRLVLQLRARLWYG
jgi:DNA-directed RNA polymerase specialized sigma24 family protein